MREIKVKNVIIGKQFKKCKNYEEFIKIVKEKNIKVYVVEAGKQIKIENNVHFEVLWPDSKNIILDNLLNNNSLVGKLKFNNFSMLFTGDIEEIAEKAILNRYKNNLNILKSTVLKVAHHRFKNVF